MRGLRVDIIGAGAILHRYIKYSHIPGFRMIAVVENDENRNNTPLVGLNVSLLIDGLLLSSELGRSVTSDEIKEKSKSIAIWK
jgi:hypothetical protein